MSGTQHGRIEMFAAADSANNTRDIFTYLLQTIDANANFTRIASNYGSGGTGFDLSGGANPSGENAFAVWQGTKYHILMQWSWASAMGAAPGNPGSSTSGWWVAVQIAYDDSGGTNIWGGDSDNDGTDLKSSPVWVADGGNLVVHPKCNGNGGTKTATLDGMINLYNGGANSRIQFLLDDDTLICCHDRGNDANYDCVSYIGPYTPGEDVTITGEPLVVFQSVGTPVISDNLGTTNNVSYGKEGGVADSGLGATVVHGSRIVRLSWDASLFDTVYQPNAQRATATLDAQRARVIVRDTNGGNTYGYLGNLPDNMRLVYNIATHTTTVALDFVYIGNGTTAAAKWRVPWDGATTPGSGATLAGVTF